MNAARKWLLWHCAVPIDQCLNQPSSGRLLFFSTLYWTQRPTTGLCGQWEIPEHSALASERKGNLILNSSYTDYDFCNTICKEAQSTCPQSLRSELMEVLCFSPCKNYWPPQETTILDKFVGQIANLPSLSLACFLPTHWPPSLPACLPSSLHPPIWDGQEEMTERVSRLRNAARWKYVV